jgi:hypothetical protein
MGEGQIVLFGTAVIVLLLPVILAFCVPWFRTRLSSEGRPPYEFATAWVTGVGVLAGLVTLYFLYDEARLIEANQNAQAYANVYQSQLGLDQVLEQSPGLRGYLERREPMPADSYIADSVRSVAEHKLDVIDYFFSQEKNVREKSDDEYRAWILYFKRSFLHSSVLCDVLLERREVYGASVTGVAWFSKCPKMPEPDQKVRDKLAPYFVSD